MNNLNNIDVRILVSEHKLQYKDIAKTMNISREWLSRLMKRPLKERDKQRILNAIEYLNAETEEDRDVFEIKIKTGYDVGDYVIYQNGDQYEIGRIKRLCKDGAFVFYNEGEIAAKTPYDCMHKLLNRYVIKETSLGRTYFKD